MVRVYSLHWGACVLLAMALVGCGSQRAEDERVCANQVCSAGMCISDEGTPKCVCGAFEQAARLTCVLLGQHESPDAASVIATDAGPSVEYLGPGLSGRDIAWYRFEAAPLTWYEIVVGQSELGDLALEGAEGFHPDPFGRMRLYFKAENGEPALFSVGASSRRQGRFSLHVFALGADEAGEGPDHAVPLPLGDAFTGALQAPTDVDAFSVPITSGRVLRLDCTIPDGACLGYFLSASWENQFASDFGSVRYLIPAETGVGWLRLDARPVSSMRPGDPIALPYELQVTDWGPDPADPATAPEVPTDGGSTPISKMFPNYPFSFVYATQPGDIYLATASGAAACFASPAVHIGDDAGSAWVTVTASSASASDCQLQVADVGPDDYPDTEDAAAPIALGTVPVRTQYAQDRDSLILQVDAGTPYQLSCDPDCDIQHLSWTASFDRFWYSSPTRPIYWSRFGEPLVFTVEGKVGERSLTLSEIPDDVPDHEAISPGVSLNRQLEWPNDEDAFDLVTSPGVDYEVTLSGQGLQLLYGVSGATPSASTRNPTRFTGDGSVWTLAVKRYFAQWESQTYSIRIAVP